MSLHHLKTNDANMHQALGSERVRITALDRFLLSFPPKQRSVVGVAMVAAAGLTLYTTIKTIMPTRRINRPESYKSANEVYSTWLFPEAPEVAKASKAFTKEQ